MKFGSTMMSLLLMVTVYKLLRVVKALPIYDDVPAYARSFGYAVTMPSEHEAGEDDELSGSFENDEHDAEEESHKEKMNSIWKINLNKTRGIKYIVQGDIRLDFIQRLKMRVDETFEDRNRRKRAARSKEPAYLWKHNTVYYKIDSAKFSASTKKDIKRGIKHWKRTMKNCLKFVRLDKNPRLERNISKKYFGGGPVEHILFTVTESGCWSQVGRTDTNLEGRPYELGQQLISIGEGCGAKGTVIHEIGHAIGFWHEQSRRDRDTYVKIVKNNILPGQKDQFARISEDQVDSMGYAYDYWSIMHYGPTFFSKNGKPTIKIQKKYRYLKAKIGQRRGLSYLDVAQARAMYKCNIIPSSESKKQCIKRSTKGQDYRGTLDYTQTGVMCQPWNKQYPHSHKYKVNRKGYSKYDGIGKHNHCRNPDGEKERPWCFTTLNSKSRSWEYCDLSFCDS